LPFWAWAYVFASIVSNVFCIIKFDQLKDPAAGGKFVFASKLLPQTSGEIIPLKPKILATFLGSRCTNASFVYVSRSLSESSGDDHETYFTISIKILSYFFLRSDVHLMPELGRYTPTSERN